MKLYIGVTDKDWYTLLSSRPDLTEINFWQPGGRSTFKALVPGELFLFKLHSPLNYIVGGGVFTYWTRLPVSLAWEAFGEGNGATSLIQMRERIAKYRRSATGRFEDYSIGCILLEQPFFFQKPQWIPSPIDWKPNIVQGKTYDLQSSIGRELWGAVHQASSGSLLSDEQGETAEPAVRYGEPILIRPRIGQRAFRVLVTDAYERRCAVTRERTLPVLEAAHIRPYAEGGAHHIDNGLLLRRDLHALFDRGYVTITAEHRLEVGRRIREDWENGRDYYAMHGREVWIPPASEQQPSKLQLEWHNNNRYLG